MKPTYSFSTIKLTISPGTAGIEADTATGGITLAGEHEKHFEAGQSHNFELEAGS